MTGPLAEVDPTTLLAFSCGATIAVWSIVVIAGFLPLRVGPASGAGYWGKAAVYGAASAIAILITALFLTAQHLPAAVAIIAAGMAVLGGPFLVEFMPPRMRESRVLPIGVVGLSFAALIALPNPL